MWNTLSVVSVTTDAKKHCMERKSKIARHFFHACLIWESKFSIFSWDHENRLAFYQWPCSPQESSSYKDKSRGIVTRKEGLTKTSSTSHTCAIFIVIFFPCGRVHFMHYSVAGRAKSSNSVGGGQEVKWLVRYVLITCYTHSSARFRT
jgi:hypothetical protein